MGRLGIAWSFFLVNFLPILNAFLKKTFFFNSYSNCLLKLPFRGLLYIYYLKPLVWVTLTFSYVVQNWKTLQSITPVISPGSCWQMVSSSLICVKRPHSDGNPVLNINLWCFCFSDDGGQLYRKLSWKLQFWVFLFFESLNVRRTKNTFFMA